MELPREERKEASGPSHTLQKARVRVRNQTKESPRKSEKQEGPRPLLTAHPFALTLLSNVAESRLPRDPDAKRDITFAAYVMGRIQWPITRNIDSHASQHLGNANFPPVQLLCLTEMMQISLTTTSFCKLMHNITIVVPISLSLISPMTMHVRPLTPHHRVATLQPKTPSLLNCVRALPGSLPVFNS